MLIGCKIEIVLIIFFSFQRLEKLHRSINGIQTKNCPSRRPPKTPKPRNIICYKALIFVLAVRTGLGIAFFQFFGRCEKKLVKHYNTKY